MGSLVPGGKGVFPKALNCGSRDLLKVTPGSKPCGVHGKYRHAAQEQFSAPPRRESVMYWGACYSYRAESCYEILVAKSSYFVMLTNDCSASCIPGICDSLFGYGRTTCMFMLHESSCVLTSLHFPTHDFLPHKYTFPVIPPLFFIQP